MSGRAGAPTREEAEVHWHDAECGGYVADLPLWEELAADVEGEILDLGCGSGRVSLHLARRGHPVVGVDVSAGLVTELHDRASGLPVRGIVADARRLALEERFELVVAPMQLIQLFDGPAERTMLLRRIVDLLTPDGVAALAIVEAIPEGTDASPPLPDIREVDGWVYSSLPLQASAEGDSIRVRRLRQLLSPTGELSEELDEIALRPTTASTLEREAAEVGLRPAGRRVVEATAEHVGSTAVLLRGGD